MVVKILSRDEFKQKIDQGRKMVWATLHDRQDFQVQITPTDRVPVRDVTDEPNHHSRNFIGKK